MDIEEVDEEFEEAPAPRRRTFGFIALAMLLAGGAALIVRDRQTPNPVASVVCADCGHVVGELHELGCLQERCPFCDGQLATCGCIRTVLRLNEAERQAVDEYVDDEIEPLRGILARWRAELDKKGRRPVASPDRPDAPRS